MGRMIIAFLVSTVTTAGHMSQRVKWTRDPLLHHPSYYVYRWGPLVVLVAVLVYCFRFMKP